MDGNFLNVIHTPLNSKASTSLTEGPWVIPMEVRNKARMPTLSTTTGHSSEAHVNIETKTEAEE